MAGAARHRHVRQEAPHTLLQAQRQRVSVARALTSSPSVIFADEPTATLHHAERTQLLRTLTTAARSHGITVVLATHDPEIAALADRAVDLLDGRRVATVALPAASDKEGRSACSLSV
ncbi:ATP-binding cassette domain-containing protein [Streptomyces sp. M10(2022)]